MAIKSLQAINDYVIVKVLPQEQKAGLIHIPDGAKINEIIATVISCGGSVNEELEAGDVVVFESHYGRTTNSTGEKLIILRDREIWGVLNANE